MAFKMFSGGRKSSPTITFRMSGDIAFNKGAREMYLDSQPCAVLYYDDEENQVGIEPIADENAEGARKLNSNSNSPGASISAKAFFENFNIPYKDEKRVFTPSEIELAEDMLIISLGTQISQMNTD